MAKQNNNPWDQAKTLPVIRGNEMYAPAPLEDGVKFFVLMVEQLGCTTVYSCEGHPHGFYIVFRGPMVTAREIMRCGYFTVEVVRDDDTYRLTIQGNELNRKYIDDPWVEINRVFCLRHAATAWVKRFGELNPILIPTEDLPQPREGRPAKVTK